MPRSVSSAAAAALLAVAAVLVPSCAVAQTGAALVTDRPDQTESTAVVPVGSVQVETGGSYTQVFGGSAHLRGLAVGGTLVRVGLWPALEARVGFAGWQRSVLAAPGQGDVTSSGVGDVELQAKLRLREGAGAAPSVALIPGVSLPTGEEGFGETRAEPSLRLAVAHDLSERLSLGWNAAVSRTTETDAAGRERARADVAYTIALGIGVSERVGAFVESFGVVSDGVPPAHSLDGGFTLLLTPLVQLDLAGGVGISGAAEDWFVGAGLSFRVPR